MSSGHLEALVVGRLNFSSWRDGWRLQITCYAPRVATLQLISDVRQRAQRAFPHFKLSHTQRQQQAEIWIKTHTEALDIDIGIDTEVTIERDDGGSCGGCVGDSGDVDGGDGGDGGYGGNFDGGFGGSKKKC